MSSSSSSSTSQWIYDVFLSFRGEDTRRNFVSHLHVALSNAGINTYIDERLERGTVVERRLMQAIEDSRISIVVFSETYAKSSWCLKELERIMKCHGNYGQVVLPIFYHVDPSDVRHQKGCYKIALQTTGSSSGMEMMVNKFSNWSSSLTAAANLSGWDEKNYRTEAQLVSIIVEDVKRQLKSILSNIIEYPVGLDPRVEQVIRLIKNQSNKVCLIGIWGMGGSGKTTTARAIYNQFHSKFVNHSFIENVRDSIGDEGIKQLQEKIYGTALGPNQKIFKRKRALIVLDDVSTFGQVKHLLETREYFDWGSVFIVTSRDVGILKLLKVDYVYRINEMDENKSLELFSWHAFRQTIPFEDFRELSESIAGYCGGLPLALEVIGTYLRHMPKQSWERALPRLMRILILNNVQKKLKISYDDLDEDSNYKNIFLDICCFFIGKDISYVKEILNGCKLKADDGLTTLIQHSLLKVEKNNQLGMHDLLRDMGREIVRQTSEQVPGKRSRLWFHEDVNKVLKKNRGTNTVKGLVWKSQSNNNVSFMADSFRKMKKLRLLQLDHVDLTGEYVHLPQKLRWLHWQGFTGDCIPDEFYQKKLVVFDLKHSSVIQFRSETKLMEMLKILNLSHSKNLTNTPDFSKLPNLEKIIMEDCPCLSKVHQSIGDLRKLLLINLKDCTTLSCLPENINKLTSLTTLILSGCSRIDKLEESIVQMKSLTTLAINDTGVKEVPYSVVRLNSIGYISLRGSEGLSHDIFHSVIRSWMSRRMDNFPINNLDFLTPIVSSLTHLRIVWIKCHSEDQLTEELKIIFDDEFDIRCTELEELQNPNDSLSSHLIGMRSCPAVMGTLGKSRSQGVTTNGLSHFFLPGGNHPSCLAFTGAGPSAPFQVPKDIDCCIEGIVLRVIYSSTSENKAAECLTSVLIVNYTKCTIHIYKRDTIMSFNDEDWKNVTSNLGPGDNVKICVAFGHGLIVKKTIVYLISGQSIIVEVDDANMEVNFQPFRNPNRSILTRLPNRMYASSFRFCDQGLLQILKHEEVDDANMEVEMKQSPMPNKSLFTSLLNRIGAFAINGISLFYVWKYLYGGRRDSPMF